MRNPDSATLAVYLDASLAELHPAREVLPHEGVRVVGALEDALQGRELRRAEGGPVAARLL